MTLGQNTWPPLGSSAGHARAYLLAIGGQNSLTVDSRSAVIEMRGVPASLRRVAATAIGLVATMLGAVALPGVAAAMPLTCQSVSGHVRDGYGTPIMGAAVDASAGNDCSPAYRTTTDGTGAYTVYIEPSLSGTKATVTRAGYGSVSKTLSVASGSGSDVQLLYDLKLGPIPGWVRPGQTMSLSAMTTAPPPATARYPCTWGDNSFGELGNGTTQQSTTPTAPAGVSGFGTVGNVTALAGGEWEAFALRTDGTVISWGDNEDGELGNGTTTSSTTPVVVSGVGGVGTLSGVTAVASGFHHALALRSDGTVVAWGDNSEGELGNGTTTSSTTPVVVSGVGGVGTLSGVIAVAAGEQDSVALRSDGSVVTWGWGFFDQLGNGQGNSSSTPVVVSGVGGNGVLNGVTAIAAGANHVLAVRSDGSAVAWGRGEEGELGNGSYSRSAVPVVVSSVGETGALTGVVGIAGGSYHSLGLRSDGSVVAWGDGSEGQLGNGQGSGTRSATPVAVLGVGGAGTLSGATAVSAGAVHSLALRADGTIVAWGNNTEGELGNATTTSRATPAVVMGVGGTGSLSGATAIGAGGDFSTALRSTPCHATSQAIAQLNDGSRLNLVAEATDSSGYTSWSGTYTVPPGTPDRYPYSLKFCAVDSGFTGNCDQAQSAGPPSSVTPIASGSYGVDNTPPSVASQTPTPNHNTTSVRPTIAASVTDGGSGVDNVRTTINLDGVVVSRGSASYSPGSDLALGTHSVTLTAQDLAGNPVSSTWQFAVVSVTTHPGSAVVPPGRVQPISFKSGASTVTFPSVPASLSPAQLVLSSSITSGNGAAVVTIPMSGVTVTFTYQGVSSSTNPALAPRAVSKQFSVLAPSSSALAIDLPDSTGELGPLTVPVPAAYQLTGGSASIAVGTTNTQLGAATDPVPGTLACSTSANCHLSGAVTCSLNSSLSAQGCATPYGYVFLNVGGVSYVAATPYVEPLDADTTGTPPNVTPVTPGGTYNGQPSCGSGLSCSNLLSPYGGGTYAQEEEAWSAGPGLFSIYGHSYYFQVNGPGASLPLTAAWLEGNAHPGAASCVSGSPAQAVTRLVSFGQSVQPMTSAWAATGNSAETTGAPQDVSHHQAVALANQAGSGQLYAVENPADLSPVTDLYGTVQGTFAGGPGKVFTAGSPTPSSATNGVYNTWSPNQSTSTAGDHELMTGAEYQGANATTFSFQSAFSFDALYDNSACLGV